MSETKKQYELRISRQAIALREAARNWTNAPLPTRDDPKDRVGLRFWRRLAKAAIIYARMAKETK